MHLIYRSKKQALAVLPENKLAPYTTPMTQQHSPPMITQKKSIDIILDKHIVPFNPSSQILGCYKPQRKTLYKPNRTKKVQSGYLKVSGKGQHSESKDKISRNKSTQIVDRHESIRRRGGSEYAPYMGQKKSGSAVKLRVPVASEGSDQRDWVCARLIERQVYVLENLSDFC